MGKARREPMSEREIAELEDVLLGATVLTSKGRRGSITKVAKRSVSVRLSPGTKPHTYPTYDSFARGTLELADPVSQGRAIAVLGKYASRIGLPANKRGNTQARQDEACQETRRDAPKEIDVASNVRIACFVAGLREEECALHLDALGLEGFAASLDEGFGGAHALNALRECGRYLGCGADALLMGPRERVAWLLRSCDVSRDWRVGERVADRLEDGTAHRSVVLSNADGSRSVAVHTVYLGDYRGCYAMQCNMFHSTNGPQELRTLQLAVYEPDVKAIRLFESLFRSGGYGQDAPPSAKAQPRRPKRETGNGKAGTKPIRVNEFLVRKGYGTHRQNGHRLDSVRATVSILPRTGGEPRPVEFDAYWCPRCRKYFMTEGTYLRLKRQGYICCKVVEEKDLGTRKTGEGVYGNLASESVLHMYGYTVNQQDDLSEAERRTIISFVIENRIQGAQDIAHLLEWLISQREGNPRMAVAVGRWRADLDFVRHYHRPARKVRVDRIYAKV